MNSIRGAVTTTQIKGEVIRFFVVNDSDIIQKRHAIGAFYEVEELAIISEFFDPGSTFVDIGTNVGNHAIYVSKYLRPGHVILFEPNPPAIEILTINLLLNGLLDKVNINHLGFGLAEIEGEATPKIPVDNLGGTQLVSASEAGTIKLARGDRLLANEPVGFLKIDVEGMELGVLSGLEQTIRRNRPRMFVEVENKNIPSFLAWAEARDYKVAKTFRRYRTNENFLLVSAI